jgi:hypothetical protein
LSWITEIKYDQSIALTSWTQGWITEMISENNGNYSGTQLIDITCDFFEGFVIPEFL